jgi:hypothetical protein
LSGVPLLSPNFAVDPPKLLGATNAWLTNALNVIFQMLAATQVGVGLLGKTILGSAIYHKAKIEQLTAGITFMLLVHCTGAKGLPLISALNP